VSVQPAVPWWRWALSGLWLAILSAGLVWPWFNRRRLPLDA